MEINNNKGISVSSGLKWYIRNRRRTELDLRREEKWKDNCVGRTPGKWFYASWSKNKLCRSFIIAFKQILVKTQDEIHHFLFIKPPRTDRLIQSLEMWETLYNFCWRKIRTKHLWNIVLTAPLPIIGWEVVLYKSIWYSRSKNLKHDLSLQSVKKSRQIKWKL